MMRTMIQSVAIAVTLTAGLAPVATAATPETVNLTEEFRAAGVTADRLQVYEIAGIVIIRGKVADKAQAEAAGQIAQTLGYQRVANLMQIIEHNDVKIARAAEVELSLNRSLDGCRFHVTSERGVVRVAGQVKHELQKDVTMQVLRKMDGVRSVEVTLNRF